GIAGRVLERQQRERRNRRSAERTGTLEQPLAADQQRQRDGDGGSGRVKRAAPCGHEEPSDERPRLAAADRIECSAYLGRAAVAFLRILGETAFDHEA